VSMSVPPNPEVWRHQRFTAQTEAPPESSQQSLSFHANRLRCFDGAVSALDCGQFGLRVARDAHVFRNGSSANDQRRKTIGKSNPMALLRRIKKE